MTYQPIARGVSCPTVTPLKANGDIEASYLLDVCATIPT